MRFLSLQSLSTTSWTVQFVPVVAVFQQGVLPAICIAAGQKGVHIKGTLEAVESYDFQLPTLFVSGSGSGNASHLGRYSVKYEFVVDFPTLSGSGTAEFVAANGDKLFTDVTGQAIP